jgi:hypothetical protein
MSINKYSAWNFTDQSTRPKEYSPQLDEEPGLGILFELVAPTQNELEGRGGKGNDSQDWVIVYFDDEVCGFFAWLLFRRARPRRK